MNSGTAGRPQGCNGIYVPDFMPVLGGQFRNEQTIGNQNVKTHGRDGATALSGHEISSLHPPHHGLLTTCNSITLFQLQKDTHTYAQTTYM